MKHIIFVLTFASITKRVLPLIEKIKNNGEIIIVTSTKQLETFFKENTKFEVIRTKVHPDLINKKSLHKLFLNIFLSKIEYKMLFNDIKDSKIYFTNRSCAIVIFSYIKKLSKNNKIYFFESQNKELEMNFPIENSLRAFLMRFIAKWMLGINTIIHNRADTPFWSLHDRFYTKIKKIKIPGETKKINNKYAERLDLLKNKEILIVYNDSITCNFVEKNEFITRINELMDVLNKCAPDKYVIKPHPRLNKMYGKMSDVKYIVPSYIPLQILLSHDWELAIGFDSGALNSVAKNTNAQVISLIDTVKYKSKEIKNKFRNNLIKNSNNNIKFLNEIKEINKFLKNK